MAKTACIRAMEMEKLANLASKSMGHNHTCTISFTEDTEHATL